ncbi:Protein CBG25994 [Caenorhabditis briggsae]|uniref:Protein CBG25994 n=1 Tax=Caenorhabditis briggsae TaxID=6238 RepID=B6IKU4_CAEBR|nr:Protein CBG25994 [Caenorhabditis briggsae]CAS00524.1 Protein CBG25994 [Caenorhabditis briggsae]
METFILKFRSEWNIISSKMSERSRCVFLQFLLMNGTVVWFMKIFLVLLKLSNLTCFL